MGVLSDLVVVAEGDAERVAESVAPSQDFQGIDVKGIDSIKLGTLHSILTGKTFEELVPFYEPVVTVSEEGPWVFKVPAELASRLAALGEAETRHIAKEWAGTEEFSLDGWQESDVADALWSICTLARKALDSSRALFLWMSL